LVGGGFAVGMLNPLGVTLTMSTQPAQLLDFWAQQPAEEYGAVYETADALSLPPSPLFPSSPARTSRRAVQSQSWGVRDLWGKVDFPALASASDWLAVAVPPHSCRIFHLSPVPQVSSSSSSDGGESSGGDGKKGKGCRVVGLPCWLWVVFGGVGGVALAAGIGAAFVLRRRMRNRRPQEYPNM
jgi:hypothetical protein